MIEFNHAKEIAKSYVASVAEANGKVLVLLEDQTLQIDGGWVFFYDSEEFVRTGDFLSQLFGNAPIIISAEDGKIFETGTSQVVQYYIDRFVFGKLPPM